MVGFKDKGFAVQFDYSLYLITDRGLARNRRTEEVVEAAILGGVTCVQVREKEVSAREFWETSLKVQEVAKKAGIPVVINDRIDIACACGADGVHIGQDDLPFLPARRLLGSGRVIGVSAGNCTEAKIAEASGADYVGAGPVFATGTKADAGGPIGLAGLRAVVEAVSIPVVAIGGIHADNIRGIFRAGAAGAAVISAIVAARNPESAARELADAIRETRNET